MDVFEHTEWQLEDGGEVPKSYPHATKWMVRRLVEGKPFGKPFRLYRTPKGAYYLIDRRDKDKRVNYHGPIPQE